MNKVLVEVFNRNCYEKVEMKKTFSKEYDIKKSFTQDLKSIYGNINNELKVEDLDSEKVLIIKNNNIEISVVFMRSFSSFWYKANITNIATKNVRKYNYQRDNCLFCPEKLIKTHDLYEIMRLVEEIS